ncbi:AAA family ATPase [Sulfurimonas sediminis]|uniref:AAA family ATPase n=1 Tax=Sulfurimonas sediminis TaxID=2590020 RepID=A0A7M1B3N3_9BACT|nr:AAA family ATPase [Sulfurimonas sediminis]QOP44343.1 AAA family ATPase [Sulfurimonas sediminis]
MIIAYVSKIDKECYNDLKDEFTDVKNFNSINDFISFYAASKNRDVVLLYRVENLEDIEKISDIHFNNNIYMIVVGKNDTKFSLLAGKIGVDVYLSEEEADSGLITNLIIKSQSIIKARRGNSNISVFTGINGGVGTTTIAMNLAKTLAQDHPEKNVLFLDFAYTKAVSNLFFNYPQPKKTIVDISNVQNLDMQELFENGLEKLNDNLYFVPGMQKHTDREELEKPENIQMFLNFIMFIKEKFDFIIIDVGVFEDVDLEVDIQEIADNIFVITEFSIPSMSILKTYIDIIDKSGWYSKTHIIANRSDSYGSVTHEEARKILSKGLKHNFEIGFALPNDALHLRECWNEAQLVCDEYPDAPFMLKLKEFGEHFFIHDGALYENAHKNRESFWSRVKQWL